MSESDGSNAVELALAMGFALAGVCGARESEHRVEFDRWLAQGKHGSMGYLERHADLRADPRRVLAGARSILLVADQYARRGERDPDLPSAHGRIARYARGRDYHRVMKRRLHALADALRPRYPGAEFRAFVDTAPILEREHAARAGLGWIGKHTLLIHPARGSWLLLGGILSTADLRPSDPPRPFPDHCGTCTRCIDACPTRAITPYSVDASRCIAYLTIERRAPIDPEFFPAIGPLIFGCDICQEVCPHNSGRSDTFDAGEPAPEYAPRRDSFDLLEVLGWTPDDHRDAVRGTALGRARPDMLKRNAAIAAGNALRGRDIPALRARLEQLTRDEGEPDLVKDACRMVLDRVRASR